MKHNGEQQDEEEEEAMDWYSWLSKSSLDPSHVYEYGLAFTRNELREEDLRYFNHEFLQSMGISVAKHRLEILKLARKEGSLSRFVMAVNKTKKLLAKLVPHHPHPHHHPRQHRTVKELSGALMRQERGLMRPCKSLLMNSSGPLDRRFQESMGITGRALSVSGPLDGKVQERLMLPSCSPLAWGGGKVKERMVFPTISPSKSGPLDAWTLTSPNTHHKPHHHSLWSLMFQDMKPT